MERAQKAMFRVLAPRGQDVAEFAQQVADLLAPQVHTPGLQPLEVVAGNAGQTVHVLVDHQAQDLAKQAAGQLAAFLRRKGCDVQGGVRLASPQVAQGAQLHIHATPAPVATKSDRSVAAAPAPKVKKVHKTAKPKQAAPAQPVLRAGRRSEQNCQVVFDALMAAPGHQLGTQQLTESLGLGLDTTRVALGHLVSDGQVLPTTEASGRVGHPRFLFTLSPDAQAAGVYRPAPQQAVGVGDWGRTKHARLAVIALLVAVAEENPATELTQAEILQRLGDSVSVPSFWQTMQQGRHNGLVAHRKPDHQNSYVYRLTEIGLTVSRTCLARHQS